MKKIRVTLALAMLLSFALTLAPQAAPAAQAAGKFPSYTSGVQVQNLENSQASVTLSPYREDGTKETDITDTIAANGSKTFFPLNVTAGFSGSMVVSSDKQVAAIANVLSGDGKAAASYLAASQGSKEVNLPLLMKDNGGFTTWYAIQNAGSGPATVNVTYSDGTSAGPFTINSNFSKVVYQSDENHPAKVFSAKITSDQDLVAAVIEESSTLLFAYTGFSGAGPTNPIFPLVNANNGGFVTGIQIQNTGSQATDVTVSYTPSSAGAACTEKQTIQPSASATFAFGAFRTTLADENCADGAKFVGSARVSANSTNQALVGIVNQLGATQGEAYGSFDAGKATAKVVLPLIMDRNGGFFTGFNIQNVGSQATNVTCTFADNNGTAPYKIDSTPLQPGGALTDLQINKFTDRAKFVGSGTCTASGGDAKIVGVVNELGAVADQFLVYEGASSAQ